MAMTATSLTKTISCSFDFPAFIVRCPRRDYSSRCITRADRSYSDTPLRWTFCLIWMGVLMGWTGPGHSLVRHGLGGHLGLVVSCMFLFMF